MKFEELIMQETEEKQKTIDLQQEVEQLEKELEEEMKLTKVLKYALDGPLHPCCPCLSYSNSPSLQELLTEPATMEEEIMWLERKVHNLNLSLYLEKKHTREWELQQLKNLHPRNQRPRKQSSFGSCTDTKYATKLQVSVLSMEDTSSSVNDHTKNPNKLSEDLIKCLIGIFLEMNLSFPDSEDGSDIVPKQISCMSSKSFISKTSFNSGSNFDPYAILLDFEGANRDIGPYMTFTQITRLTLDHTRISECSIEVGKLRVLMQKLCSVNLNLLTYNACTEKPGSHEQGNNQRRGRCGKCTGHRAFYSPTLIKLQSWFPEPNVPFALCRGSWSSPALRVYTSDDIINELVRAKLEYLEASVGIVSKKKIMVPKLLQWHIKDFADDMESLLEWIYRQFPQSGSLKRLIMECLINGETKSNPAKMIEVQPYVYEFQYLLPSVIQS
ncbi:hypothetical protein L1987_25021 [Smallanthus sonchifolius]|uniref:Uncharacterized protein n=1 Tax=Smallanthus sonchifolius TaxID=185202 RepID=A0ACB9IM36_9ASTR|nr:hypothetical protein L1987_25021 [Smallanthus sonchifolius]